MANSLQTRHIVFCRGASEKGDTEDGYISAFESKGFTCTILPTLCFEYVNIDILRECLQSPQLYDGLILTSKRAARAVLVACEGEPSILQAWKSLPTYCVGPASEAIIKSELGFENCLGSETGNAEQLSDFIVGHRRKEAQTNYLLYPCNEMARETIQQKLESCDIPVTKIICYKPFPSKTLEQDLQQLVDIDSCIIVFFSPSMVDLLSGIFSQKSIDKHKILAAAIGPATEKAVISAGLNVYATARKPDPESLLQAILEAQGIKSP